MALRAEQLSESVALAAYKFSAGSKYALLSGQRPDTC
jgi:hypothetical protein